MEQHHNGPAAQDLKTSATSPELTALETAVGGDQSADMPKELTYLEATPMRMLGLSTETPDVEETIRLITAAQLTSGREPRPERAAMFRQYVDQCISIIDITRTRNRTQNIGELAKRMALMAQECLEHHQAEVNPYKDSGFDPVQEAVKALYNTALRATMAVVNNSIEMSMSTASSSVMLVIDLYDARCGIDPHVVTDVVAKALAHEFAHEESAQRMGTSRHEQSLRREADKIRKTIERSSSDDAKVIIVGLDEGVSYNIKDITEEAPTAVRSNHEAAQQMASTMGDRDMAQLRAREIRKISMPKGYGWDDEFTEAGNIIADVLEEQDFEDRGKLIEFSEERTEVSIAAQLSVKRSSLIDILMDARRAKGDPIGYEQAESVVNLLLDGGWNVSLEQKNEEGDLRIRPDVERAGVTWARMYASSPLSRVLWDPQEKDWTFIYGLREAIRYGFEVEYLREFLKRLPADAEMTMVTLAMREHFSIYPGHAWDVHSDHGWAHLEERRKPARNEVGMTIDGVSVEVADMASYTPINPDASYVGKIGKVEVVEKAKAS